MYALDYTAESGEIRTLTPLDYEVVTSYSLTIRAVDMGVSPRTGELHNLRKLKGLLLCVHVQSVH